MNAPPLADSKKRTIRVSSVEELNEAVASVLPNTTIVIEPGQYRLTRTLGIETDDVTIQGATDDCSSVVLTGRGMDEANHSGITNGFWINAKNTRIANLSIGEVYFHTISINNKAHAPHIYNVRMFNSGQQFVKSNPVEFGVGVNLGIVEFSVMEYTDGTPKTNHDGAGFGYTNGVDIHAGKSWRISNNRFNNFHTPDGSDYLWNPAVLVWNGASDTITENNIFINVDRAVAYGLDERSYDHKGGVIRNNMIAMPADLYSGTRRQSSDAVISILDSPGTKVLHNTILTNGNTNLSIELRFDTSGAEVSNNITDALISHRDRRYFIERNNITNAQSDWFINPSIGDLRLKPEVPHGKDQVRAHRFAANDINRRPRPSGRKVDLGAHEYVEPAQ